MTIAKLLILLIYLYIYIYIYIKVDKYIYIPPRVREKAPGGGYIKNVTFQPLGPCDSEGLRKGVDFWPYFLRFFPLRGALIPRNDAPRKGRKLPKRCNFGQPFV